MFAIKNICCMSDIVQQSVYCPRCAGKQILKEPRSFRCADCDFLFYINSGAATGVILLNKSKSKALFVRRVTDPCAGMLDLPGGFLEPGETLEEGAIREISEELSLDLRPEDLRYLCSFPNTYHYKGTTYYTLDAFFTAPLPDQTWKEDSCEVQDAEMLEIASVRPEDLAFTSHRKALEILRNSDIGRV